MGNICKGTSHDDNFPGDIYSYRYDWESKQIQGRQNGSIRCKTSQIQSNMLNCSQQLNKNRGLYKDPFTTNEPLILKPVDPKLPEIRCTYLRPYNFLHKITKEDAYPILNNKGKCFSHVFVRDASLQYFGVFLCFLADHCQLVDQLILNEPNSYGIHAVKMKINHKFIPIYIDDFILCKEGKPIFAQPINGKQMWPCLLQKAWLKRTSPELVFQKFLSYPYKKIHLQSKTYQNKKALLREYLSVQQSCILTSKQDPPHKIGLSGRRHYYLKTCIQHQRKTYYYLRDPCGFFDFRGSYNNPQQTLTKQTCRKVREQAIYPGNFILDQDQIIQQISSFIVLYYNPSRKLQPSSIEIDFNNKDEKFIEFQMQQKGELSLCFKQNLQSNEQKYSPITFQVINNSQHEILSDLQNQQGSNGVYTTYLFNPIIKYVNPGTYLIRIKKKKKQVSSESINNKDNLTATFIKPINFQFGDPSEMKLKWQQHFLIAGRKELNNSRIREKTRNTQDFDHIVCWRGDLLFIYVRKTNQKRNNLQLEVYFPELTNLVCLNQEIIKSQYKCIDLNTELIILFEKINLMAQAFLKTYTIQCF